MGHYCRVSSALRRRLAPPRLAAGVLVVLGLSACGGSSTAPEHVRDFSEVLQGKVELRVASDARSAEVRLATDPPTVCAVAFGEDADLGRIANDPGMGGSAIARHAVVLRGLAPNTTYRYRLTATDARGRVYQTRVLSFATGAAKITPNATRNAARGAKVIAVSSEWGPGFEAKNALDGDLATEWSSNGDGNAAFLAIDLGAPRSIVGVAFRTREMADGSAITRSFTVTIDGNTKRGPFPTGDRSNARIAAVSATGRRLRFDVVDSTGGNTGADEIEVYTAQGSG
jgi:hypothetical protein